MSQIQYGGTVPATRRATFSIPSILSILCAIGSFMVNSAGMTLVLAIAAGVLGLIGVVVAIMPNVRGGILSFIAIGLSAIGILIAIGRLIS